ncbi:MAG: hypothetical protein FWF43_06290 [Propionibacteriaceae bacterium]|nr:hypothetical protein [Propionibacteriaceae bacterium]
MFEVTPLMYVVIVVLAGFITGQALGFISRRGYARHWQVRLVLILVLLLLVALFAVLHVPQLPAIALSLCFGFIFPSIIGVRQVLVERRNSLRTKKRIFRW